MEGYTCRPMIYSKLVVCMVACPKPVGLGQAICMGVVGQVCISLLYKKSSFSPLTGCVPVPVVNTSMFRPANSHSFRAMRYPPFIVQSETPAIAPILSSYIYVIIEQNV